MSKIPSIFWFAAEVPADVLLIYHPASQKDDISFPPGVESVLFSAYNTHANTLTAICIGQ